MEQPMPFDSAAIRNEFPSINLCDGGLPRIYFDNPAGTQVPRRVIEQISDCLVRANANLGGHFASSRMACELVDAAHQAMADFLGAGSAEEIVFGQNTTSLIFHISRSIGRTLSPGDEIVLTRMDHDANIGPWLMLAEDLGLKVRWWEVDTATFELDINALEPLLGERTRLVAVNHASNALGTVTDVAAVVERAHAHNALVFVDSVQYAPHALIDVRALGCDFLVCSPYKFYGPHQGVLWGRRELLEGLTAYRVRPAGDVLPHKFETGTLSHEGMAGTLGAVEHIAWVGQAMGGLAADSGRRTQLRRAFELLQGHENELVRALLAGLAKLPGLRVLGITDPARMAWRVPTVSFVREQHTPEAIVRELARHNIFAWNGHNYALELYRQLGMERSGGVRIGFAQYNTLAEVEQLLEVLGAMV
ncbi:MAG: cysteine desulfurase-like protein [Gammaproteobacteria bacterium]|jgi:cysteine desulfurase family protein (TIGR01976 family)|nr:cysteine desulfurase-like protein [Gammaproteobacteria bacterium]MBK7729977.1 cysteine desulfurase-like protein [Gammaproteobacteria bacterium]MBK8305794.1 cysteine desulfurase-like protein [Gammaproteobacteria bacterium]MBK9666170.1 cysteine desulfurase-like protein [Gammaproteobacteria bacterium]